MLAKIFYRLSKVFGYKESEQPAWKTVPKQISTTRIKADKIKEIINNTKSFGINPKFERNDNTYKLVDIGALKTFTTINNLARYKYIKEERDCDNFMFMLNGDVNHWDPDLAVGNIKGWKLNGDGHAWNWCIGTDMKIWFIEPQNNKIFELPQELWEITKLEM